MKLRQARSDKEDNDLESFRLHPLAEDSEELSELTLDRIDRRKLRNALVRALLLADAVHMLEVVSEGKFGYLQNRLWHGRGEEQRLPRVLGGKHREHLLDLWSEAHFEQLVCLVKNQHAKASHRSGEPIVLQMVIQSAWSRHEDVGKVELAKCREVSLYVGSTVDALESDLWQKREELLCLCLDLACQLSCRRNDQHRRHAAPLGMGCRRVQLVQGRNKEGERFASSRFCLCQNILPRQRLWN